MAIPLTRPGKTQLIVESPVMPAAGIFGYGSAYRDLVNIEKLGAIVTNPVTYSPWNPASGTRVVPLDAGVLVHTGLPNPGLRRVIREWEKTWESLPAPVVLHLVAISPDDIRRSMEVLDDVHSVTAVELGLNDDISWEEAADLTEAAVKRSEKPILVRLPLQDAYEIAEAVADAGAGALVIAAPPRGTARDKRTGRLIGGRVYGPLVKPMALRVVGSIANRLQDVPIIGAGGVHTPQDARDYIEAGAVAVQVDSVTWIQPKMLEVIARDLGGLVLTRASGAFADEWHPGIGQTDVNQTPFTDQ